MMMMNANSNSVRNPPSISEPTTNNDGVFRNMMRMRHSLSWGSRDTINVGDDDDDDVDRTDEDDIFLYRTAAR